MLIISPTFSLFFCLQVIAFLPTGLTFVLTSERQQRHYSIRILQTMKLSKESSMDTASSTSSAPTVISSSDLSDAPDVAMKKTYDKVALELIEAFRMKQNNGDGSQRLWVGVVGAPGSGKTTFAQAVVKRIQKSGVRAISIPMDGFHYSQSELKELGYDILRRGAPWTFDATRMYEKLKIARENESDDVYLPDYSRDISDPVPDKIKLDASCEIIVIEGLYLMLGSLCQEIMNDPDSPAVRALEDMGMANIQPEIQKWEPMMDLWDQTLFIEPPCGFEENKRRLVERSLKTWTPAKTALWGGGTAREAATRRVEINDARNAKLIQCCKPYATFVIEST